MSIFTTLQHDTPSPETGREFAPDIGRAARATGWILTGLATVFLGFDAVTHLLRVDQVIAANADLGAPDYFVRVCGVVLAAVLVAYLVPATRAVGTVLVTAYLGGAVAVNLLAEQPGFNTAFAIGTAVVVWAGAWPRDARLRALARR